MLAHYTNYKYATFIKIHELKDKKEDHEFEQKQGITNFHELN
jgi:hypothetical protein